MNRCISFEEMLHMEPSLEQRIRERAYEIWNATGRDLAAICEEAANNIEDRMPGGY